GEPVPAPTDHGGRPGVVMFFNLECSGCISRGIPFLKRLESDYRGRIWTMLVHTSYGHRDLSRDEVVPTLQHFAEGFARLPMPVALDVDASLAHDWGVDGTPHWFVFDGAGVLQRSVYGSQDNARTRLEYLVEELVQNAKGDEDAGAGATAEATADAPAEANG
ncbi:MAG: hypothetical protein R6W77_13420, partial [Trueperaceae bacterium]